MSDFIEYKPMDVEHNVQAAVENLRTAYKLTDTINVNDITKSEWDEGYAACLQVLSELIDSAPTVEMPKHSLLPLAGDCDKAYMRGYELGKAEALLRGRPQGEWIPNKGNGYSNPGRHCSLCGKNVEFSEPICPGCGAQMKIGGEES